jgi:ribose/xylose/arabinose/galactoside ABC-type transport system permease subunit
MHRLIASTFDLVAITISLVAGAVIGVIAGLQSGGIRIEAIIISMAVIALAFLSLTRLLQPPKVILTNPDGSRRHRSARAPSSPQIIRR